MLRTLCSERLTRTLTLFCGLLEVLGNFWERGSHFHSTLGPINYIADPVSMTVFEQESYKTYNKERNPGAFVSFVGQYGNIKRKYGLLSILDILTCSTYWLVIMVFTVPDSRGTVKMCSIIYSKENIDVEFSDGSLYV